jgi:phage gpG-like protein
MTVRVEGLRETVRSLEKFGTEVADLKAAFKKAGNNVVRAAQPLTNPKSGRLAASIRASNTKNKSEVRAGGARVPYAGVQHYGGYQGIQGKLYLTKAAEQEQAQTVRIVDDELNYLIRKLNLN